MEKRTGHSPVSLGSFCERCSVSFLTFLRFSGILRRQRRPSFSSVLFFLWSGEYGADSFYQRGRSPPLPTRPLLRKETRFLAANPFSFLSSEKERAVRSKSGFFPTILCWMIHQELCRERPFPGWRTNLCCELSLFPGPVFLILYR